MEILVLNFATKEFDMVTPRFGRGFSFPYAQNYIWHTEQR